MDATTKLISKAKNKIPLGNHCTFSVVTIDKQNIFVHKKTTT